MSIFHFFLGMKSFHIVVLGLLFYKRKLHGRTLRRICKYGLILFVNIVPVTQVLAQQVCFDGQVALSTPGSRFLINKDQNGVVDGTVTDLHTAQVWKVCSEGLAGTDCAQAADGAAGGLQSFTWFEALAHVKSLNQGEGFAGFHDWRLPNLKELMSIVEFGCVNPAINATIFPATSVGKFWTNSPLSTSINIWAVSFTDGQSSEAPKISNFPLRLIRGTP